LRERQKAINWVTAAAVTRIKIQLSVQVARWLHYFDRVMHGKAQRKGASRAKNKKKPQASCLRFAVNESGLD
jgi:hypothetical protein